MRRLFQYRDLIANLVVRELTVRYRRSAIGFLWTMLQPLLTMLVLYMVFSTVFRFQIRNYPVYALSGILFWNFFSQSISVAMTSLGTYAFLLQVVPIPKAVFPVSTVLAGVMNLGLALLPLLVLMLVTGHPLSPALLFLPVSMIIAVLFTLGAGLLLSPLAVFFTDVVEMVKVGLMLMFYITPCFYPMRILPERFLWVVRFNPIRSVLEVFRDPIYLGKIPPVTHFLIALGLALGMFCLGVWVFRRSSDRIAYYF